MQLVESMRAETDNESTNDITDITKALEKICNGNLDKKTQKNFSDLIVLLPSLEKINDPALNAQARIATAALTSTSPNFDLAKIIIKRLAERLRARNSLAASIARNGTPAVRVVLGLGVLLYFVIPISMLAAMIMSKFEHIFGMEIKNLALVVFFGALGSIVSIMVRLHHFAETQFPDKTILFFTGFFKPIVGMSFALFIYMILNSGILPITVPPEKIQCFFASLSFIAGFSERFAQDVVSKTESTFGQKKSA